MERSHLFFCSPPKGIQQIGNICIWWLDSHKPWGDRKAQEFLSMPLPCNSVFISLLAVPPWKLSTDQTGAGAVVCRHNVQLIDTGARERSIWPPVLCQHLPVSLQWPQAAGKRSEQLPDTALLLLPRFPHLPRYPALIRSLKDSTNTIGDFPHWKPGWFTWFKPVESLQQEMLFPEYTPGLLHGKQLLLNGGSPQKLEEPQAITVKITYFRDF